MSARQSARRRRQPYAWLGAGAVTFGMGAAMVGGTAVAFADTGTDSASSSSSSASDASSTRSGGDASSNTSEAPKQRASRTGRGNPAADDNSSAAVPAEQPPAVVDIPEMALDLPATPDAAPAAAVDSAAPVAETTAPKSEPLTVPTPQSPSAPAAAVQTAVDEVADPVVPVVDSPAADEPAPAASVAAAAVSDPAPNMDSWLPATPIVPGARVTLALQQIEQSQQLITQETWGSGNILAGLGSFGPQAALATAQLMLAIWAASIGNAQSFVASTVDNPLIHPIAQLNLQNELLYPALSDLSLATASALLTPLGWFGADIEPAKELVAQARQNGKIYAKVPVTMKLGTQPMVDAKLNGGRNASLLIDTGASGLVTTRDKIGSATLGAKTGEGDSCFSGGICYHYETYNMTVDLGDGAVTTAPVNLVTDNATWPNSVQVFKDFFSWGADGILGVGANTAGPGPAPIPTAVMPGELSNGVLIYQNAYPFGLGGYMILGPNLFPTKVSLPGAPDAYVKVSVNGGPKQNGSAIIDSGGVYGTLNRSLYPGSPVGTNVPAGTKIDVYAPDGTTLLYSYTTQAGDAATPFIDSGLFNTGNAPYEQNPIYLNYATTPYGIGSTDFSIY
ncbi:PecA family PE domain-processing aspartic protease [Mycolicibacterium sp.]|uniref:PecA family PE domain-processing aspartic protease n=1 Tax=Mycolicibacterium sp. TaxID=2320850 RepID=UPI0028A5FAEC|nr:PecA family PE domain-processing aspartic protease [Mycolicibacterium sp.]